MRVRKKFKARNVLALNTRQRSGAGPHKNKQKEKLRTICRAKVVIEDC